MARKHLQLNPHRVTNDFWWYEEDQGICVCTEFANDGRREVKKHKIPWRSIRAALKRKDSK